MDEHEQRDQQNHAFNRYHLRERARGFTRLARRRDDPRVSRRELPLGEMKRYHVTTFGCQMNEHDSERMKGMLESIGYAEAPSPDEADLILFNTCSIREAADTKFVAHLGHA